MVSDEDTEASLNKLQKVMKDLSELDVKLKGRGTPASGSATPRGSAASGQGGAAGAASGQGPRADTPRGGLS